jgi:hypothetical protein
LPRTTLADRHIGTDAIIRRFRLRLERPNLKEGVMPSASKTDKIEHPQTHYATPDELIDDPALSLEEKTKALDIWEQDALQMLTASGEGMPGSEEGKDPNDRPLLARVQRAKDKLQRQLKREN